jgi:hypothetical protein
MSRVSAQHYAVADKWLKQLGVLCCGNMTAADAELKCSAYASMICDRFPMTTFTKEALGFVAGRCKFFPSYGEVLEHLGAWFRENLPAEVRLGIVPALPLPDLRTPSPQEQEHVQATAAAFAAEIKAKDITMGRASVTPRHLYGAALAIARRDAGIPLSPELRAALAEAEPEGRQ